MVCVWVMGWHAKLYHFRVLALFPDVMGTVVPILSMYLLLCILLGLNTASLVFV